MRKATLTVFTFAFSLVISFVAAELGLRITLGFLRLIPRKEPTAFTEKANWYGWAFRPRQKILLSDPDDTRIRVVDQANENGWKDIEHPLKKPSGTFRILFLGDSYTQGMVPLKDLYTRVLQGMFDETRGGKGVEIISMGVGGWGTDQSLEALLHEGVLYQPDLVVYQFYHNDIRDNTLPEPGMWGQSPFWKKKFKYRVEQGVLRKMSFEPEDVFRERSWLKRMFLQSVVIEKLNDFKNLILSRLSNKELSRKAINFELENKHWDYSQYKLSEDRDAKILNPLRSQYSKKDEAGWKLFEALVQEMQLVSKSHGSLFAIFPILDGGERDWFLRWEFVRTDLKSDFAQFEDRRYDLDFGKPMRMLDDVCTRQGIRLLKPKQKYERYNYDPHLNAKGNLQAAQDIYQELSQWLEIQKKS